MKKIILLICLISIVASLNSQKKLTLSGFVKNKQTKEVLIGSIIYNSAIQKGTYTNGYGFYSLTIPYTDTVKIFISFTGYKKQEVTIYPTSSKFVKNIFLEEGVFLDAFNVEGAPIEINNPNKSVSLEIEDVKKMPNFFGEVDVIKAYHFTPGVQSGGEARSDFFVRGGSSDQNLILLDNVPLYNVNHFGGFLSVFNTDAINNVQLIKGGFPAKYGSRLSSVLDVKMKEGNMDKFRIQGMLGLLSSKVSISTPIIKEKMSLITSIRGSLIPFFSLFNTGISYNFYDINTKLNYIISDKNRIYFSFYKGKDILSINNKTKENDLSIRDKSAVKWGNMLISGRWNRVFSSKLFSSLTLYNTRYNYSIVNEYSFKNDTANKEVNKNLTTGINDFGLKYDFSYFHSTNYNLKFGLAHIYHVFKPNNESYNQKGTHILEINKNYESNIPVQESAIYVENILKSKYFSANIGGRLSNFKVKSKNYFSIEPRLSLNYTPNDNLSFNYSYSKMNQFIHLLSNSSVGLPSDFWMPSTEKIKPENSIQHSFGISLYSKKEKYKLTLEGYYKTMNNLIAFLPGQSLESSKENWENIIVSNGEGGNYGVELFLQKIKGKTTGWISGTLSRAIRRFEEINEGESYPFKYDRLLDFSIVVIHTFNKNISLSTTWNYGTGYPITIATEKYALEDDFVLIYGKKNSYKMKDYHRLDVSANFTKKMIWGGVRTWSISIYNVYNRKNPYFYFYQNDYKISDKEIVLSSVKLIQQSLFSFFPSISFSFKF